MLCRTVQGPSGRGLLVASGHVASLACPKDFCFPPPKPEVGSGKDLRVSKGVGELMSDEIPRGPWQHAQDAWEAAQQAFGEAGEDREIATARWQEAERRWQEAEAAWGRALRAFGYAREARRLAETDYNLAKAKWDQALAEWCSAMLVEHPPEKPAEGE